ncbi:MAG: hypothetical protein JO078_11460 [Candidatus Eremiobacteraeota bacterium]|nr:hypothetical protein [Candidatus Eremiobacteraeota bacterium]MBV9700726.1 hypothetical protein [Candidatus Eremiobacteraeota bacterium]
MKAWIGSSVIALAACSTSGTQVPMGSAPQTQNAVYGAVKEMVIYSFPGSKQQLNPNPGNLLYYNGTLYGTTLQGGANSDGTIFAVTPSGSQKVLHTFNGAQDAFPGTTLAHVDGALHGTIAFGGTKDDGAVFTITTSGSFSHDYDFKGTPHDGAHPVAGVIDSGDALYGTTKYGGANDFGTVFRVTPLGKKKIIYGFGPGTDGADPFSCVIDVNGTLYGTTNFGGTNNLGTVFAVSAKSGQERILHSFAGGSDGASPLFANLTFFEGAIYGTTPSGGAHNLGVVFRVTPSGTETVVHSFGGTPDGAKPEGGLVAFDGKLYGTTSAGGANHFGTVFSVAESGTERVVYSFGKRPDGQNPSSGLTRVAGTLYGTTYAGGAHGEGTVFSLVP